MSDELQVDYNLQKTLEWCAENEVVFGVTNEVGIITITARNKNIYAEYAVDEPYDARALGNAAWAALYAVKHGSQFHERFGHYPPVGGGATPNPEESGGAGVENGTRENSGHSEGFDAPPGLRTPFTP